MACDTGVREKHNGKDANRLLEPTRGQVLLRGEDIRKVRFRKFPFTCSPTPFRDSTLVGLLSCFLGFSVFVVLTSDLERRALMDHLYMILFALIACSTWFLLSRFQRGMVDVDRHLIFEDTSATFELLDRGRGL